MRLAALVVTALFAGGFGAPVPGPGPEHSGLAPVDSGAGAKTQRVTGSIRGRVEIRRTIAPPERRPNVADLASAGSRELPDIRRAVVFLEGSAAIASDTLATGRARMDQRNETFVPHVLDVDVGTFVDFPNNDSTYHNVFSLSKAKRFDLGRYAKGSSKAVRFEKPGVVRVFCDIHSHMSAFILVFSHPHHVTTDADGRYRLDNIPPGTYTVSAWHEGSARETRTATIPPQGGSVDLDFVVGRDN